MKTKLILPFLLILVLISNTSFAAVSDVNPQNQKPSYVTNIEALKAVLDAINIKPKSVDKNKGQYEGYILSGQEKKIINPNNFRNNLSKPITRIELAEMIVKALDQDHYSYFGNDPFVDTKSNFAYIIVYVLKFMSAKADKNDELIKYFMPKSLITKENFSKIISMEKIFYYKEILRQTPTPAPTPTTPPSSFQNPNPDKNSKSKYVTIPDPVFEQIIRNKIYKPKGPISEYDLKSITRLNEFNDNKNTSIKSLDGLQYMTNLTYISLVKFGITDISPIKSCNNLENLHIEYNSIRDFSCLSSLRNLKYLNITNNKPKDLNFIIQLIKLESFSAVGCGINDISQLSNLKALQTLELFENNISNINSLRNLNKLTSLKLHYNSISDISPLSGLIELKTLDLSSNKIVDAAPLSKLTKLFELNISSNVIKDISDLKKLTMLEYLNLNDNRINDISVLAYLNKIKNLGFIFNCIKDLSPVLKIKDKLNYCYPLIYQVDINKEYETDKKIIEVIDQYIKPEMSAREKIKTIHDYILKNTVYDYDNYIKNTIPIDSSLPFGTLIKKTAVCGGYALTFSRFMKFLDIPCCYISGDVPSTRAKENEPHAWNSVFIDGDWLYIDTTWDDQVNTSSQMGNNLSYKYFLIAKSEMDKDHFQQGEWHL